MYSYLSIIRYLADLPEQLPNGPLSKGTEHSPEEDKK